MAPIDRARAHSVVGILATTFAVALATGILLSRTSPGVGQVVDMPTRATTTMIDPWRLGDRAVPAAPGLPTRMLDPWRLGDRAVPAAPAQPTRMFDAWRLAAR
jgi:hypothetical protein